MKFYNQNIVKKVRKLRKEGLPTGKISRKLKVPPDAVLRWCFDIPSKNAGHLRFLKIKDKLKHKGCENVKDFIISKNNAKIIASLIYWCEGFRYPSCNCVGFSNSDLNLVKTFLELFRIGFDPKEEKFRAHLQLHTTHDRKEMLSFWSNLLKIPKNQFHKPTITKPMNKMKRIGYKGTCTVKYYDFILYNEIIGIYEAFSKKIFEK
ncbi:MAG: hypothetical protein NTW46_03290 [Candidatus Nealsonbacteria bacterium]|nr:hypothetical protein [Candidatus Nealsonbacteria bacterium]